MVKFLLNLFFISIGWFIGFSNTLPKIDVVHLELDLDVDVQGKKMYGLATIHFKVDNSCRSISLNAAHLDISSIKNDQGVPLEYVVDPVKETITISWPYDLLSKINHSVSIAYNVSQNHPPDPGSPGGSFGKGLRFMGPSTVQPGIRWQVYSMGEPNGNIHWFPCNNDPSDLRTTTMHISVDSSFMAVASGNLIQVRSNQGSKRTYSFASTVPYANYLTCMVVGQYVQMEQMVNNRNLLTLCYPDEVDAAKASTVKLKEMYDFISEFTASDLPFREYRQVMVQAYPFPGKTGQHSLTTISDNMIDDVGTHSDYKYLWDGVEFNALASQWFGSVLSPASWKDTWLIKGLAQWLEGRFTASQYGEAEYELWYLPWEWQSYLGEWQSGTRLPLSGNGEEDLGFYSESSTIKYKSALVLRMLEKEMGATTFKTAIRQMIREYAGKPYTTEDFQIIIEKTSGKDMQWFFDQWIYQAGHPEINVSYHLDHNSNLLFSIQQQVESISGKETTFFRGKFSLQVDSSVYEFELQPLRSNNCIVPAATQNAVIIFDRDQHWIAQINDSMLGGPQQLKILSMPTSALQVSKAMKNLVDTYVDSSTTSDLKLEILDKFLYVAEGQHYWRLKMQALQHLHAIVQPPYPTSVTEMALRIIQRDSSWVKATAISLLGKEKEVKRATLYADLLHDKSDRVVNAAAIALGHSGAESSYESLLDLESRPSWKNQSLMHQLNGMARLNDDRVVDHALKALSQNADPRWYLANAWDFPIVALQALLRKNKSHLALPLIKKNIDLALKEKNYFDLDHSLVWLTFVNAEETDQIWTDLMTHFKEDEQWKTVIAMYKEQNKQNIR